jgi:hypothetical protein
MYENSLKNYARNKEIGFKQTISISLFLYGIYAYYTLNLTGDIKIPFAISFFSGLFFIIKEKIPVRYLIFLFFVLSFLLINIFFTPNTEVFYLPEKSKAFVIFSVTLVLSLYFLLSLLKIRNEDLAKYFYRISVLILILCVIQLIFPPFQKFNEYLYYEVYGKTDYQFLVNRDILNHGGFKRPFPLTSEPSHASKFLFISLSSWLLLSQHKKYFSFFILVFLSFLIIRSPIVLAAFPIGLISILKDNKIKKDSPSFILLSISFTVFLVGLVFIFIDIFSHRIGEIATSNDVSTLNRVILPWYFVGASVNEYPLLGVGLGNFEHMIDVYNQSDFRLARIVYQPQHYYLSDLSAPLVFFGIGGTFIFLFLFYMFFKSDRIDKVYLMYGFLILSLTVGNFYGLILWTYMAIFYRISLKPLVLQT